MTTVRPELLAELDSKGYAHIQLFSAEELAMIRGFIRQTIQKSLDISIERLGDYHAAVTNEQHRLLSDKLKRVLSAEQANAVLQFSSLKRLFALFPCYVPAAITYGHLKTERRPEVYFRLVRPHMSSDVGPMHRDQWFHVLENSEFLGTTSYKMWISIESSVGENGLILYPAATLMDLKYKAVQGAEGPKPAPDFEPSQAGPELLVPALPGDAIIFTDSVLHKGALNGADTTRVSVEITLCKPPSPSAHWSAPRPY